LSIFAKAWADFIQPHPLNLPARGILLSGVATLVNAGWAAVLLRTGRFIRSAAMTADGRHLLADIATSVGVIAGVGLVALTGTLEIDPAVAAAAGVYVLWSGLRMISRSVGGLMDAAPDRVIVQRIRELLSESASGALEAHDLRTRHAGRLTYLEFHLVVPGNMTVAEAHAICDRIEARLKEEMDYLVITIHVEPEEKAKQHGVPIL
jgi:cation diffusion facilitator family transporter